MDKFIHGVHKEEAIEYLKEIGVYDQLIKSAKENVFGNNYPKDDGFLMIIAANNEYNKSKQIK